MRMCSQEIVGGHCDLRICRVKEIIDANYPIVVQKTIYVREIRYYSLSKVFSVNMQPSEISKMRGDRCVMSDECGFKLKTTDSQLISRLDQEL